MSSIATRFRYQALDAKGHRVRGTIEATGPADAMAQIRARGQHPLAVDGAHVSAGGASSSLAARRIDSDRNSGDPITTRLSDRDLELFFSQLAKMVAAGLSLERALSAIGEGAPGTARADCALAIVKRMRAGASPSKAFAEQSGLFDASTLALLRSGELTGDLGGVLAEIERLLVARNALRSKVRAALIYPTILALVALGSVLTILLVVIPQFEDLVRTQKDQLPVAARVVFWLSSTVRGMALPLAVAALAGLLVVLRISRRGGLQALGLALVRLVPRGRDLIQTVQAAALLRMLGSLVSRQVLLLPAIEVARQSVSDPTLEAATNVVHDRLKSGGRLAQAMLDTGAFPPIAVQLARVGEETGDLGSMLTRAASMLEDDLERQTKLFLIWFEPMLLVVIGVLIGGLLYGLFSAILSINSIV
jgi:general secretion pathway protein F